MTMLHVPRWRFNVPRRSTARTIKAPNGRSEACSPEGRTMWAQIVAQPGHYGKQSAESDYRRRLFCFFFGTGELTGRWQCGEDGEIRDLCLRQSFNTINHNLWQAQFITDNMTHFGFLSYIQLQGGKFRADLVHRRHPTGLFTVYAKKAYGYRQSLLFRHISVTPWKLVALQQHHQKLWGGGQCRAV